MAAAPVCALEIGTSKVIALVGEMRADDGHVMITGMGEQPSSGVRKAEIINFEHAAACVRAALLAAEETSGVAIREVLLAVSGGHIQSVVNRGAVPVRDSDGEITLDDIDKVMEVARAVNLPPDREILHTICQEFCIDDRQRVVSPEGMAGAKLSLEMLVLHGVRGILRNTVRVVTSIPMDVTDVVFSGLCSALAVLTPEQKKSGVVVIDFGAGTTEYLAYAGGVLAAAGALGVGGDHVTNDVALGFNIPMSQAERCKCEWGSATREDSAAGARRVSLPPEVGFPGRSISQKSLSTVINARVDEILDAIKRRLEQPGLLQRVGSGIVMVGGGAHLRGIAEETERVFGLPCTVGKPRWVSGLATATEGPQYAACSGLVQYGFGAAPGRKRASPLGSWFKGLFGR